MNPAWQLQESIQGPTLKYPSWEPWLDYKRGLILDDWDDLTITTGREGKGKSAWARKVARKLDPGFRVKDRVFFSWEPYEAAISKGRRGDAFILDEFRGHKRESMTKDRMSVLDEFKENRGLGLRHFIVFNKFTALDRDLTTDRAADWCYIRRRGEVEVRQPKTELYFSAHGEPEEPTTYPLMGHWTWSDKDEPVEERQAYRALKDERMRDRQARKRGEVPALEAKAPVHDFEKSSRIAHLLADMGQQELKR